MKKKENLYTMIRIKKTTLKKFNYARVKSMTPESVKYPTQEEFLLQLLERTA